MNLLIILKTTLNTLAKNKLRSFITLLSIVLGIATIATMYNIGLGFKDQMADMFKNFGPKIVLITDFSWKGFGESFKRITIRDAEEIRNKCPEISTVLPQTNDRPPVKYKNFNQRIQISCTSSDYFYVSNKSMESGSFFGVSDQVSKENVCVLGQGIARKIFKSQDAVGNTISISNVPFKVIGVFDHIPSEYSPIDSGFPDYTVYVPYTTAASKLQVNRRKDELDRVVIFGYPSTNTDELVEKIKKILNTKYHITEDDKEKFNVETMEQFSEFRSKFMNKYTLLLNSIAIIALFVSGINIMNIMLVSVKQRTREIGVRLALGARKKDISSQFLAEAVLVCLIGGLFGAVLSVPASLLLAKILQYPVKFSYNIILISFFYSAFLGIVFGVYPAHKAASIEPIEALRYE